jgi:hypothetical protein
MWRGVFLLVSPFSRLLPAPLLHCCPLLQRSPVVAAGALCLFALLMTSASNSASRFVGGAAAVVGLL